MSNVIEGRNPVIRGVGYILAHAPDMVLSCGTTQTTERIINPDSDYLTSAADALRSYDDVVSYAPNQVYIGGLEPETLRDMELPWFDKPVVGDNANRYSRFGEIMPQDELLLLMRACDAFELVVLVDSFISDVLPRFKDNPIIEEDIVARVGNGVSHSQVESLISESGAHALHHDGKIVGCVKNAHNIDENLSAHVMLENIASKATAVLSLLYGLRNSGVSKDEIEYVIDCSEEACGDMNQRGGGGLSKSIAEVAGLPNAAGSDLRSFCAGPAHAIVSASALVSSGVYKSVVVVAGGSTAKLGMNGKDHVKKGLPILEDVLGGFCVVITENDGVSPVIDLEIIGRHTVSTGSSPQAVISSLVTQPLNRAGMKILDVDIFASEMQNPDVTKPAGAGDVPLANYKMIGALAVMQGELEKSALNDFIIERGLPGWAPTQGHIPSGVPLIGFAYDRIMAGTLNNAMIIGKGSLFLGRMTNLFDGVSFLIRANGGGNSQFIGTRIAVAGLGSELGEKAVYDACVQAVEAGYDICYLGSMTVSGAENIICADESACGSELNRLLESGECVAGVTMHHTFPIGTATVGRVITPINGKEMFIATTTGTPSPDKTSGLVLGALYGIIAAKACGVEHPTVGFLNIDGARRAESAMRKLQANSMQVQFAESARADGGAVLRGNDVLLGTADVLVCDSLTGNVLMKMLTAYESGGDKESTGYGYGPGISKDMKKPTLIVSRASDTPVIFNAIKYAADITKNQITHITNEMFKNAEKCGLNDILSSLNQKSSKAAQQSTAPLRTVKQQPRLTPHPRITVAQPPREIVTEEIAGIEILDIEEAAELLWQNDIYAESGMGCTGPVVMVNEENIAKAKEILQNARYID